MEFQTRAQAKGTDKLPDLVSPPCIALPNKTLPLCECVLCTNQSYLLLALR